MNITVKHITNLYPNICNHANGIAIKKLIDNIPKKVGKCSINNEVFLIIPYSCFPLNLLSKKWSCLRQLRIQKKQFDERIIETLTFPKNKFSILCSKILARKIDMNKNKKNDIIHCHTSFRNGYVGRYFKKKQGIPYVITLRRKSDFDNNSLSDRENDFIRKNIQKASAVIAPSMHLKKKCLENTGVEAILIPNGIDEENIISKIEYEKKIKTEKESIEITTVATLDVNKRIDLVLKVFSRIQKSTERKVKLNIVGSGLLKENLIELTKELNLLKKVEFHGKLEHQKVIELLRKSDIFFLPSKTETFGLVYLEALANGVPIVGTRNQGIDGVALDRIHGFFGNNEDEFTEAILRLIGNKEERLQMGENGIALAKDTTWKKSGEKLSQVYYDLIKQYR